MLGLYDRLAPENWEPGFAKNPSPAPCKLPVGRPMLRTRGLLLPSVAGGVMVLRRGRSSNIEPAARKKTCAKKFRVMPPLAPLVSLNSWTAPGWICEATDPVEIVCGQPGEWHRLEHALARHGERNSEGGGAVGCITYEGAFWFGI